MRIHAVLPIAIVLWRPSLCQALCPRPKRPSQPFCKRTRLRRTGRFTAIGSEYGRDIRPIIRQFCLNCHSTAKQKGDFDLERFATLKDVRRDTKVWLKVAEMLDNGEMPPKEAKQPPAAERKQLRGWVDRYLHAESLAKAGDPGPVVLRRLSNAEYTYTIRDLTGVDLNPARDFPTDGAAGEGFTNTGNALVMSPALLTKYFDAGREISPTRGTVAGRLPVFARRFRGPIGRTTSWPRFGRSIGSTRRTARRVAGQPAGDHLQHQRRRPAAGRTLRGRDIRPGGTAQCDQHEDPSESGYESGCHAHGSAWACESA